MRVADGELEVGALELRPVADALDLEVLLEALRHAFDHVRDERAREAVERTVLPALGRARHDDLRLPLVDLHAGRHVLRQLAERTIHLNAPRRDRHHDAGGELDGSAADS
jgi:transcriptional regulator GlxA family with amidase domain